MHATEQYSSASSVPKLLVAAQGSRKNSFTFLAREPPQPTALRKLGILRKRATSLRPDETPVRM